MADAFWSMGLGVFLLAMWWKYKVQFGHGRWRDRRLGVFEYQPTVKQFFDFTFLPVGVAAVAIGTVRLVAAVT